MILESNRLFQGNCLEILKEWPAKCVDVIITDPPYEAEAHTSQRRVQVGKNKLEVKPLPFGPISEKDRKAVSLEFGRLVKRWVLIFCQIEAAPAWRKSCEAAGLEYKRTCIWVKPDGMPQFSGDRPGMGYETILAMHQPGRSHWQGGGRHGVFIFPKGENQGQPNEHPTTKPLKLMRTLVNLFSDEGEIVLDAYAGSGTTLVAAEELKRRWLGIEIDPTYCALANSRIKAETAQGKLW